MKIEHGSNLGIEIVPAADSGFSAAAGMKLIHLDRIYRIIRIYFGLVFLYPVHLVDPVRKWIIYAVKFFIRSKWPFF
jgi:hypothetical protein